jgi:hypothetical protein
VQQAQAAICRAIANGAVNFRGKLRERTIYATAIGIISGLLLLVAGAARAARINRILLFVHGRRTLQCPRLTSIFAIY